MGHPGKSGRGRAQLSFAQWLLQNNKPNQIRELLTTRFDDSQMETDRQFLLGMAARMLRDFDQSQEIFTALHQQAASSFPISNQLALVLIKSRDESLRSRALQIAEANVRNHSNRSEAWSTLGWIQFRLGDAASALENLSRAASAGVISRDTAWQLAQVHLHNGNKSDAEKLLVAARESSGPFFYAETESAAKTAD